MSVTSHHLEVAKGELLVLAVQREPLDDYARDLVTKLKKAGLTRAKGGRPTSHMIEQIMSVLGENCSPKPAKSEGRRTTERSEKNDVSTTRNLPRPQNIWSDFPQDLENYDLERVVVGPQSTGLEKVISAMDLPPFANLNEFYQNEKYHRFIESKDSIEREIAGWRICQDECGTLDSTYRRAWMFLLGVNHGFAHEVPSLKIVKFPSPWSENEFVIARLKASRGRKQVF